MLKTFIILSFSSGNCCDLYYAIHHRAYSSYLSHNLASTVFHNGWMRLLSHQEYICSLLFHILTGLLYNSHYYSREGMATSFVIHFSENHWHRPFFICRLGSYILSLEKCLYPFLTFSWVFSSYHWYGILF